jgi:hypothetical protein
MDEDVGHKAREQVEQVVGAGGRKDNSHARTLTERKPTTNPPVLAKTHSPQSLTKTFGTPSINACSKTIVRMEARWPYPPLPPLSTTCQCCAK